MLLSWLPAWACKNTGEKTAQVRKPRASPFRRRSPAAWQKSLAEFAARRRQRNKIIFSRDMCVRENTARTASVEFVRHRRTNYARSRPQTFCRKNPEGFSTVSAPDRRSGAHCSLKSGRVGRGRKSGFPGRSPSPSRRRGGGGGISASFSPL